jgi:NAD-dependent DNA ligase
MSVNVTKDILQSLYNGDASCLTSEVIYNINQIILNLLNKEPLTTFEIKVIDDILHISNIIYNNTDRSILVLEDGIYDLLLEKYKRYNPNFQVGAEPIQFQTMISNQSNNNINGEFKISPYTKIELNPNNMFYYNNLMVYSDMTMVDMPENRTNISKRIRNVSHKYPQLVGTLDKVKFVLDNDAIQKGVYKDPNVKIFERDFLAKHVREGYIDPNNITLVLELKYDGVSVEAEVTDHILTARTRGDTGIDKASDLTPILGGYPFKGTSGYSIKPFGMKFEAIVNKYNLQLLSRECGKNYVNSRNAIIGILGSSDASMYAKYITLVPLATSHDNMNRIEEIEFMNKYYNTGEALRYVVISGNYESVLFQLRQFVIETEAMRDAEILPFMYDGVVVSYLDPAIRNRLGRKNSINKYSIAIKFNPKKKLTRVRNITYTVGANGDITPMIWYDPIEFYGMINTKSSGHSYSRFMELNLKPGDVIQADYVNDVMVYISKPNNIEENFYNPNPYFSFIDICPECGSKLVETESRKNVICPNINCPGRLVSRMTNMLSKLGFKGFSEETVKTLKIQSFYDFIHMTEERASILGEVNGENLMCAIANFLTTPIVDYNVLGALGFTGIASGKWKLILKAASLKDIIKLNDATLMALLSNNIKGISYKTASVIVKERQNFMKDLLFIYNNMDNIILTNGTNDEMIGVRKTIRFTGVRDQNLMTSLSNLGHDCSEGSVTKTTDILITPYEGFESSKVTKAKTYNLDPKNNGHIIKIIPLQEFYLNQSTYLGEI